LLIIKKEKKAWKILANEKEGKRTLGKFLLMKKKEKERLDNSC
jgi:hypothetical protein